MPTKQFQEAYERAKALNVLLRADDPRLRGSVQIVHDDGSILFYEFAFVERHPHDGLQPLKTGEGWWFIFTEHHGFHVYATDEVKIRQYKRADIKYHDNIDEGESE